MAFSTKSTGYLNRKVAGMYRILNKHISGMENYAKRNAGWTDRTSHARQSIHSGITPSPITKSFKMYLAYGVKYGQVLEEGSPPHTIKPKNKKYLYWNGADHPVKQVEHPGTEGYGILEESVEKNKDKLKAEVVRHWGVR